MLGIHNSNNSFPLIFRHFLPASSCCCHCLRVCACEGVLEFLPNAAGEDVVAGVRTPQPLEEMAEKWPAIYAELFKYQRQLEQYYGDMQVHYCSRYTVDKQMYEELFSSSLSHILWKLILNCRRFYSLSS